MAKQQRQPARKGISIRDLTPRHDQTSSVVYLFYITLAMFPYGSLHPHPPSPFHHLRTQLHRAPFIASKPQIYVSYKPPPYSPRYSPKLLLPRGSIMISQQLDSTRLDSPRSRQHSTIIPDAQLARMPEPAILRKRQPEDLCAFRTLQKS